MEYSRDKRIVMTLDAGGTNFVFSAMQAGREITQPVQLPANGDDLDRCIQNMIGVFETIQQFLNAPATAISFAFPGPADYRSGIIGDLANLPAFRGGIPLGPLLEEHFRLPVYINNDGNLLPTGKPLGGILPGVNQRLEASGSKKRYHNLVGLTLGTGFGGGIVLHEKLLVGDNSLGTEVWTCSNRHLQDRNAEEGVSARAVINYYKAMYRSEPVPISIDTCWIFTGLATGNKPGNKDAAVAAYQEMGKPR